MFVRPFQPVGQADWKETGMKRLEEETVIKNKAKIGATTRKTCYPGKSD
jgi:hypothetical protein